MSQRRPLFWHARVAFIIVGLLGTSGLLRDQLAAQELSFPVNSPSHIEIYGPQCTQANLADLAGLASDTRDRLLMSFDEPAGMCTEEVPSILDRLAFVGRRSRPQSPLGSVSTLSLGTELPADTLLGLRLKAHSSQDLGEQASPDTATSRFSLSPAPADQNLSVRLQPYVTRDFLEATRPLEAFDSRYKISPLDPTDRIYGFGVLSDYKVSSWLHLNSSYRFNIHSEGSRRSPSAVQQGGDASHSLFFGITVPFQKAAEDD